MELKQPKRKPFGNRISQSQPLPVLVESISGITACNSLWPVYIGTFSGDSVIVSSRDEMTSLYNMGFFGKGCLSRGYPSFGEDKKGIPPIICERQWKRRKLWMDQLLSFTNNSVLDCDDYEKPTDSSNNTIKQKFSNEIINSDFEDVQIIETESDESIKNSSKTSRNIRRNSSIREGDNKCSDDEVNNRNPSKQCSSSNKHSAVPVSDIQSSSSLAIMNVTLGSNCRSSFDQGTNSPFYEPDPNQSNSVIVIDDSGSDDEQQLQSPKPRLCNELIKTAVETLNLTLEEAFFLSFGLGCLQVVDLQGIFLSLQGMWHLYKDSQPDFISSYVSYHYFRSKGWIVKPGSKFGGNFLLYKQGPPFYHASYIVLIEDMNNKFNNSKVKSQLTWTKVMGLNRIAETAGKEILLSQVQWPEGVTTEDLDNPNVISKFKVQEVLLRRWNSGHEREEKEQ